MIGQKATINSVVDYGDQFNRNYIVLVLESPHYCEFDVNSHVPLGPAQGSSGRNINKYLLSIINNPRNVIYSNLHTRTNCLIVLINAVQYQMSLGQKPINQFIRNNNFNLFWQSGFQTDLKDRLDKYDNGNSFFSIV